MDIKPDVVSAFKQVTLEERHTVSKEVNKKKNYGSSLVTQQIVVTAVAGATPVVQVRSLAWESLHSLGVAKKKEKKKERIKNYRMQQE